MNKTLYAMTLKSVKRCLFFCFLLAAIQANASSYFFYIQLTDKNNSPYTLNNPSAYLSQRAIERRAFFDIPIDSTDLPVNPNYLQQIRDLGIHIHCTTKWLNGVTVLLADSSKMAQTRTLPFVKFTQFTGITNLNPPSGAMAKRVPANTSNYGTAYSQINQLYGQSLHQAGYTGQGMQIAVIDAGFLNVNSNPFFRKLNLDGRIIGTKDFVDSNSNIYSEHNHGAHVLSTMAADSTATYTGTAPNASYLLIRTEADVGEYLCEPDFWISGIEYADSVGVDLATTSLGYSSFDIEGMNYQYSDLDGKTIRASKAASMAFEKGIMMLVSAGNEGNKSWKYVSAPDDAAGVNPVGSVNAAGSYSAFSSIGPTPDGRVKPELCAMGTASALVSPSATLISGNGTSFATPIMAGLTACYLQAAKHKAPHLKLNEIRENIYMSATSYATPSNNLGYGIPNFQTAYQMLLSAEVTDINATAPTTQNSFKLIVGKLNQSKVLTLPKHATNCSYTIYSTQGKLLLSGKLINSQLNTAALNLAAGAYIIHIKPF